MPDYINVEPDELRRTAAQEDRLAAKIRAWGQIPEDWLKEFPDGYGTIAHPVHQALTDYYNRRHEKAERLADTHEKTRDELLTAAQRLEESDQGGGSNIRHSGNSFEPGAGHTPGVGPGFAPPGHSAPNTTATNYSEPGRSPATPESKAPAPVPLPGATAPITVPSSAQPDRPTPVTGPPPSGVSLPAPTQLGKPHSEVSEPATGISAPAAADGTPLTHVPSTTNIAPGQVHDQVPVAAAGHTAMSRPATPTDPGASGANRSPRPLRSGAFVASLHTPAARRTLPPLEGGRRSDQDLLLATTLLAAIAAAAETSAPGVEWAVAVARRRGALVMVTSNQGRGWLPAGLHLPEEVVVPWHWSSSFEPAYGPAIAALEDLTDPARILTGFCSLATRQVGGRLSALASTTALPEDIHTSTDARVSLQGSVRAAECAVDLGSPGPGLVDRLAVVGSDTLLQHAIDVPDSRIHSMCVRLARSADTRLRTTLPDRDGIWARHRTARAQVLDSLLAQRAVPTHSWDQLHDAFHSLAAMPRELTAVSVGRTSDRRASVRSAGVCERLADELLLLVAAGNSDRQTLREVLYTYGQIADYLSLPLSFENLGQDAVASAPADRTLPASALRAADATFSTATVSTEVRNAPLTPQADPHSLR